MDYFSASNKLAFALSMSVESSEFKDTLLEALIAYALAIKSKLREDHRSALDGLYDRVQEKVDAARRRVEEEE